MSYLTLQLLPMTLDKKTHLDDRQHVLARLEYHWNTIWNHIMFLLSILKTKITAWFPVKVFCKAGRRVWINLNMKAFCLNGYSPWMNNNLWFVSFVWGNVAETLCWVGYNLNLRFFTLNRLCNKLISFFEITGLYNNLLTYKWLWM